MQDAGGGSITGDITEMCSVTDSKPKGDAACISFQKGCRACWEVCDSHTVDAVLAFS
jgi:hypothetical protein